MRRRSRSSSSSGRTRAHSTSGQIGAGAGALRGAGGGEDIGERAVAGTCLRGQAGEPGRVGAELVGGELAGVGDGDLADGLGGEAARGLALVVELRP
jgi:hypothetical protein